MFLSITFIFTQTSYPVARRKETLSDHTRRVTHRERGSIYFTTDESSAHLRIGNLNSIIMPTYYSRLTSVQLAVADLRDTTTIKPESRPHPAVYDEITSCAAKFARASINGTLDETPILTEDANRSHMRFLGKPPNMPFLMVRVGEAFDDLEVEGKRTRRPARVPPSIMNPVSRSQNPTSSQLSAVNHIGEAGGAKKPVGCENGQHIFHIGHLFAFHALTYAP